MKKLFAVMAIATVLIACNNESKTETTTDSSAITTPPVVEPAPATPDSTVVDSTAKPITDSAAH